MARTKTRKKGAPRRLSAAQAAAREQKRKREQKRRIVATALIVAVVAGLVVLGVVTGKGKNQKAAALPSAADPSVLCSPDQQFDAITSGNGHTTAKVNYTVDPPSGGDHNPNPAAPGIYVEGKSPGDSRIVHALEHGYIAIWYNPDSAKADLAKLENLWKTYKLDVILIERRTMPSAIPVVATAWHHRLLCSGTDDFQLNSFIQEFVNRGPEAVPHTVQPEGRSPRT